MERILIVAPAWIGECLYTQRRGELLRLPAIAAIAGGKLALKLHRRCDGLSGLKGAALPNLG